MDDDDIYKKDVKRECEGPRIHYLPFKVDYNGPAKVSVYFHSSMDYPHRCFLEGRSVNSFRGIKIYGTNIKLGGGLRGFVLYKTVENSKVRELLRFNEYTSWEYDEDDLNESCVQVDELRNQAKLETILNCMT